MTNNVRVEIPFQEGTEDYVKARKAFLVTWILFNDFYKVEIQFTRIKDLKNKPKQLQALFIDTHFLFISVANVKRSFIELKKCLPKEKELIGVGEKYTKLLKLASEIRDDLEHVHDGRLDGVRDKDGKELDDPTSLGNLYGDEFDFAGRRINLKDLEVDIDKMRNDLLTWTEGYFKTKLFHMEHLA